MKLLSGLILLLFGILYASLLFFCIRQEERFSLPEEKRYQMKYLVLLFSVILACVALYAYIATDWQVFSLKNSL